MNCQVSMAPNNMVPGKYAENQKLPLFSWWWPNCMEKTFESIRLSRTSRSINDVYPCCGPPRGCRLMDCISFVPRPDCEVKTLRFDLILAAVMCFQVPTQCPV